MSSSKEALEGYDPVAYFALNQPFKGDPRIHLSHKNRHYLFIRENHKKQFLLNPDKYLPQFEGYCLYSFSEGVAIPGNPLHYLILDHRLYFLHEEMVSAWNRSPDKEQDERLRLAHTNWKEKNFLIDTTIQRPKL